MQGLFKYLLGGVGLGIMVFVHEFGHFLAAKAVGVGVEVFSLGWGPRLVGFTRGSTEYRISWLLIGGFCKLKGDEALSRGSEQNLAEMPHEEGSFFSASAWRRILVTVAGPAFNLVFALLVFTLIWWAGFTVSSPDNRIVLASDYTVDTFASTPPATEAGLATGDRITAIDGRPVENFQGILEPVSGSPGHTLVFTIERNGAVSTAGVQVALDTSTGAGRIGVYSWVDPVVRSAVEGSSGAVAGLQPGDRIVRAGTREVRHTIDLYQALAARPATLTVGFRRSGAARDTVLVLEYGDDGQPNLGLDFVIGEYRSARVGPGEALVKAAGQTWQTVILTIRGIGLLFRGVNLRNAVAGPLRLMDLIGSEASSGFALGFGKGMFSMFNLLAWLSVALFLMNLLPIPAMDGGQLILHFTEIVRRRPVRPRTIWRVQMIGFSVLITLFLFLTFNDILFKIGR